MEAATIPSCCANPGCDQPGTNKCSACETTPYCGSICQTADWPHHKEECEGHLLKVGNAHLSKANGFFDARNWVQTLRYSDLALVKLNAMKKRPLEVISLALEHKCQALKYLARYAEALQCAKDKYNLWALARGPAHPLTIDAAFYLIECLLHNKEYEDAELYARTLWEISHTNNHRDNDIPGDKRAGYVAMAADLLAQAIFRWVESGGIPPGEKQQAGEEAIARARQALEIYTQLHGTESRQAAVAMCGLSNVLDYFNDNDDDEVLRLLEQGIAVEARVAGRTSRNVGARVNALGVAYDNRARRAHAANDRERCVANLELALPHFREAARVCIALNHTDAANSALSMVVDIESKLRLAGRYRQNSSSNS